MNFLIVLGVAAFGLGLLWAAQSIALWQIGEPLAWPLRFETSDPRVKVTSRVMIHIGWFIIIFGTPLALGISPREWFHQEFPTPVPWRDIIVAFWIMLLPIWLMYALCITVGWVRIQPKHDAATRRIKLLRRFIGPLPLATLEEAVFRGVLLEKLLRSFPEGRGYAALAIMVTSAIFASMHFIKTPAPDRSIWQPAWGLFIVSCLFGLAYLVGGRSLWLPIAMHSAAIFGIEPVKLYVAYQGPPWIIGYSEFPNCGLLGSVAIPAMAI
ncbi:JDVT-CTERM system glutamic-type intramembrane protease, partial [Bradyrhizobium sp.]|uniref:JDVT-CTERM system glutamic-type intramembrane protease n=1 Tax=Bradyrhizobium sp. TaxID=376 RepID=UPI0025C69699